MASGSTSQNPEPLPPNPFVTQQAFNEFKSEINARFNKVNEDIYKQLKDDISSARNAIAKLIQDTNTGMLESTAQLKELIETKDNQLNAIGESMRLLSDTIRTMQTEIKDLKDKDVVNFDSIRQLQEKSKQTNESNTASTTKAKYRFNSAYKLDVKEKWSEGEITTGLRTSEFRLFKMRAETYLESGPPGIPQLLAYSLTCLEVIELDEKSVSGELVHAKVLSDVQNALELDSILFKELSIMLTDKATEDYILPNERRCGMEVWRRMNEVYDPKNIHNVNQQLKTIKAATATPCNNLNDLYHRLLKLDELYKEYTRCAKEGYSEVHRKDEYLNILPIEQQRSIVATNHDFNDWSSRKLRREIDRIIQTQVNYGHINPHIKGGKVIWG